MQILPKKCQIEIDCNLCQGCEKCLAEKSCKTGALFILDKGDPPVYDNNLCLACSKCVDACKFNAIKLIHE